MATIFLKRFGCHLGTLDNFFPLDGAADTLSFLSYFYLINAKRNDKQTFFSVEEQKRGREIVQTRRSSRAIQLSRKLSLINFRRR